MRVIQRVLDTDLGFAAAILGGTYTGILAILAIAYVIATAIR